MKKGIFSIVILSTLLFIGCDHPGQEWVNFDKGDNNGNVFQAISESDVDLDDIDWNSYLDRMGEWEEEPQTNAPRKVSALALTDMLREVLDMLMDKKVHQVAGIYKSVDLKGDTLTISGKIMYPTNGKIRNVILVSHYTIGADRECPSQTYPFEGIYAAFGYCVVATDYIGFGSTKDQIHPYLQADVCARNVIDMGLSVMPFLKKRQLQLASDSIYLLGYSQGGACTMHTLRLLETYPDYAGKLKVKRTFAGGGPYNVAETYDYSMKLDKIGIPCAVPMIVQGMSIGMRKPLDMNYFFREPLRTNYDEWLNSKNYTVKEINKLIGTNYLSKIMTSDACDKNKPETARFYMELVDNSIPDYWTPQSPVYMFHSEDDNTVPFINSQILQLQFRENKLTNVEYDFNHYGNHMIGAVIFIIKTAKMLKK